ncbi:MAG: hypothetical protein M0P31_08500 [Solirubrobacteraceae bacterium]|nr:hypothetical protein [Solirubrobacteraceae bacterium]
MNPPHRDPDTLRTQDRVESPQPAPRVPVRDRILAILANAPRRKSGEPESYEHRGLAKLVYDTDAPTSAQLSAVRRATAKLVADGLAQRNVERWPDTWQGRPHHVRARNGTRRYALNPTGIGIYRAYTDEDRKIVDARAEQRAAALAANEATIRKAIP